MISSPPPSIYPGLDLQAFALLRWDGTSLTILKNRNFATFIRLGVGGYTATFNTAMIDSAYLMDTGDEQQSAATAAFFGFSGKTAAGFSMSYNREGVGQQDFSVAYVAIYR